MTRCASIRYRRVDITTRQAAQPQGRINYIRDAADRLRAWWDETVREHLEEGLAIIFNEGAEMIPKFEIRLPNGLILAVEGAQYRAWSGKPETEAGLAAKISHAISTTDWSAVVGLYGSKVAQQQATLELQTEQMAQRQPRRVTAKQALAMQPTAPMVESPMLPMPQQPQRRNTSLKAVSDLLTGTGK